MGKMVSGLLGMNNGSKAGNAAVAAGNRYAQDVYFKPYTMTSGYGTTSRDANGGTTTSLSAPYAAMEQLGLGTGAQSYLGAGNLMQQLGGFDVGQRAADIYGEQSALLQPSFQKQGIDLQNQLVGSGRLGLMLSGGQAGAGAGGGLVQPDAFGLARAQQQTLADLAAGSRQQALGEMGTMADTATGLMSAGAQQAGVYAGLQDALTRLGIDAETARSAAAAAAGNVGTSGYQQATQAAMNQDKTMGSFWGSLFTGFGK